MSILSGGPFPVDLTDLVLSVSNIPFLLSRVFPTWNPDNVRVKPVSGGITNMLIKCTHSDKQNNCKQVVLVRTYGQNTGLIIDREDEFKNHLMLNRLNLAPMIYARFNNGIVYGFLKGRSLTSDELSDADLYPLISQKLGYWHHVLITAESNSKQLKNSGNDVVNHSKSNLWDTLKHWVDIAPNFVCIQDFVLENSTSAKPVLSGNSKIDRNIKEILFNEINWLHDMVSTRSVTVKSHCDLLSGNIVIPPKLDDLIKKCKDEENANVKNESNKKCHDIPLVKRYFSKDQLLSDADSNTASDMPCLPINELNPISFIDYEYMLNAPRGFDIANHLQEWQGFNCDKSKILEPTRDNDVLRKWCYSYLIGCRDIKFNDPESVINKYIDSLIDEIFYFYGVPGFYWGIWSCIQDKISNIDFDYGNYSVNRLSEYFSWKKKIMQTMEYELNS